MQERRAAGDDLHGVGRDAERGEQRQRVALRVIGVDRPAAAPMAAFAARLGEAAPDRRRGDALVVLAGAEEDLPDLEQGGVGEAAPRVALGRGDQAGNKARPHVGKIGGDRIGERQLGLAAAEQFGRRLGDERPCHGFAQAQRRQRALGEPGALLQRRQHRRRHAFVGARQRGGGHAVEAGDADDLLDNVGLAFDVGPPARHDRLAVLELEAEPRQDRLALALRDVDAEQPLHFAVGEGDRALRLDRIAGDDHPRRLAAAQVDHQMRRQLRAGDAEIGIDAALEAIARVGDDAEFAPGRGDVGASHSALSISTSRVFSSQPECSPPITPAIDSTPSSSAITTMDLVERVGLAVERQHALAGARAAHGERALDLGGVEHVQRPAAIEGDVIGDVDQRADRPEADGAQPLLHPFRRRAVGDAAHQAQREGRAEMSVAGREVELDRRRAVEGRDDRPRRVGLELAEAGGGEIAGDAGNAGRVGPVGGQRRRR